MSEIKQREVEMQRQLKQEKVQHFQAEKEVAIAAACVIAYASFADFEDYLKKSLTKIIVFSTEI